MATPHFTESFAAYVCEGDSISCTVDGFSATARVYRDDCRDKPDERDCGFWPSRDKDAAGYVAPRNFKKEQAKAESVMAAWLNDEWFYCGIAVTVARNGIELTRQYDSALWGVECNYPGADNSYLREVANDLLCDALGAAKVALKALCDCDA
jgi:hypothetical protein